MKYQLCLLCHRSVHIPSLPRWHWQTQKRSKVMGSGKLDLAPSKLPDEELLVLRGAQEVCYCLWRISRLIAPR